jgi:hypothetical protein
VLTGLDGPSESGYGVQCLRLSPAMVRQIASGEEKQVRLAPGLTVGVRSPDVGDVYVVAMQFRVSGGGETRMGSGPSVWFHRHQRSPCESNGCSITIQV